MSWRVRYWWQHWAQFPSPPNAYTTGFRLWWMHDPPHRASNVTVTSPPPIHAMRGRCTAKGTVRMPRVRVPGSSRSVKL